MQLCQSVVFMSDPQQGTFTRMVIKLVSFSVRDVQKERAAGSMAAGHKLNFDRQHKVKVLQGQ